MFLNLTLALLIASLLTPLLAAAVRWRAPGRTNTPLRSFLGFFVPMFLLAWGGLATVTQTGPETWGALWMLVGGIGVFVAILLADIASPPEPTPREIRRARRRDSLLDPVYFLYMAAVTIGLLTAGVTRIAFAELA